MYCPIVMIFPSLRRLVPSDVLPVIFCKSGINVKVSEMVEIRECSFKGFPWYC